MARDAKQPIEPVQTAPAPALHQGERGRFWRRGEPLVWTTAAALAGMLTLVFLLLAVVLVNGLGVFWPKPVAEVTLAGGTKFFGQPIRSTVNPDDHQSSTQFKTANREQDPQRQDFRWIRDDAIAKTTYPPGVLVLERAENGDFYGFAKGVAGPDVAPSSEGSKIAELSEAIAAIRRKAAERVAPISAELSALGDQLQKIEGKVLVLSYRRDRLAVDTGTDRPPAPQTSRVDLDHQIAALQAEYRRIKGQFEQLSNRQQQQESELRRNVAIMTDAAGKETPVALADIVRFYDPNDMGFWAKCGHYLSKIGELLCDKPRESNTEGGLFPAIFGTVMLIFLMAITCFPLGVLAGIYLGEYAKDGFFVRLVRIAVNNLAGIPSIVYGIFGLGFFVYGIGGLLDQWCFPERVAAGTPTFGTGGILWASLTLGLLTVPVVIVSTEEALRAIPRATREGSFALGATKFQTLVRVLVPMASPGMMTGFILAMARAAGEVAPLMITGVVKLAPQMPLDGSFPFFHLDRKFMHLGFHIYDVGFQSPNVEASKPMVFVTTLLLLLIVLVMSSAAIYLRNRMKRRYQVRTI
ncbi:MAG: phosphate ABC transporter permease PstA [Thermoguttaceae bacterium]